MDSADICYAIRSVVYKGKVAYNASIVITAADLTLASFMLHIRMPSKYGNPKTCHGFLISLNFELFIASENFKAVFISLLLDRDFHLWQRISVLG